MPTLDELTAPPPPPLDDRYVRAIALEQLKQLLRAIAGHSTITPATHASIQDCAERAGIDPVTGLPPVEDPPVEHPDE